MTMKLPRGRVTTRRLMLFVAGAGLMLGGLRLLHDIYYESRIRVFDQLAGVHGITGIRVYGGDDITYESRSVQFVLAGRPDAIIKIGVAKSASGDLGTPEHLWLERLGPWEFHRVGFGHRVTHQTEAGSPMELISYGWSIDVGELGAFAGKLPVKIRDVRDLVTHYDELVQHFSTWPDENCWGVLAEKSGAQVAYCRTKIPRVGVLPPPPQFPKAW
jgi:hypothetical protein